ncbi:MAG: hypothetical protein ACLP8B_06590 [Xanthobacteraceae bacterium]
MNSGTASFSTPSITARSSVSTAVASAASHGEKVWVAHRSHFYQRATDNGYRVIEVVGEVFGLNIALATLAAVSLVLPSPLAQALLLAAGAGAVAIVLLRFNARKMSN